MSLIWLDLRSFGDKGPLKMAFLNGIAGRFFVEFMVLLELDSRARSRNSFVTDKANSDPVRLAISINFPLPLLGYTSPPFYSKPDRWFKKGLALNPLARRAHELSLVEYHRISLMSRAFSLRSKICSEGEPMSCIGMI